MAIYFSDLTDYGKGIDLRAILGKYRIYFAKIYTTDQIIQAIHEHCREIRVVPQVPDLLGILEPKPPKISHAEFIHAKQQWANQGFPPFSDYRDTVKAFEMQELILKNLKHGQKRNDK